MFQCSEEMSFDHSNSRTHGQQNRPMWNLASTKDEQFVIYHFEFAGQQNRPVKDEKFVISHFDLQTGGQQHWQDHCEDGPQAFAACRSGNFLVILVIMTMVIMTIVLTTTMLMETRHLEIRWLTVSTTIVLMTRGVMKSLKKKRYKKIAQLRNFASI